MNSKKSVAKIAHGRRKKRIRAKVHGSSLRPRISFFKSDKHVYVQVIDDDRSHTLVSIHSFALNNSDRKQKDKKESESHKNPVRANVGICGELGKELASKCLAKGIKQVVFDRNGFPYHGRIKAFAEAAREGGLVF
ncbi:MAG: 50S ribosomal protein L18 [Proteobacteria bacterium]|nr:50S ribosomal protein L18 [Pseudomonadota bacterium]